MQELEKQNLKIAEIPTSLKKDGRNRKSHLKTFSDGWKHLKYLMMLIQMEYFNLNQMV